MNAERPLNDLATAELALKLLSSQFSVTSPLAKSLDFLVKAIDLACEVHSNRGRIIYVGAGSSGRVCVADAAECETTFGVSPDKIFAIIAGGNSALSKTVPGSEDDVDAAAYSMDLYKVDSSDLIVGVSASGQTPFVTQALRSAKDRGSRTVFFTFAPQQSDFDVDIHVNSPVGAEVLEGSTRLKAATATKMLISTFSTTVMVRSGYVWGNKMVGMQPVNEKLKRRAVQIVSSICNIELPDAVGLLEESGYDIRVSILMAKRGLQLDDARGVLQSMRGNLASCLLSFADEPHIDRTQHYYMGIDSGATSTDVLIGKKSTEGEKTVLASISGPPSNISMDFDGAVSAISSTVERACAVAGNVKQTFDHVYIGAAGAGNQVNRARLKSWAASKFGAGVEVEDDIMPILRTYSSESACIVFVFGTGSIAKGRSPDGKIARFGGWGWRLHNGMGAYGLVVDTLSHLMRAFDEDRLPNEFVLPFLKECGRRNLRDLVDFVNDVSSPIQTIASFAKTIVAFGEAGEPFAGAMCRDAAISSANAINTVWRKLQEPGNCDLVFSGGVVSRSNWFRDLIIEQTLSSSSFNTATVDCAAAMCLRLAFSLGDRRINGGTNWPIS